ncbi:MAG: type II toxin-antitoxin system VapC family toxin [Anaerolineae bacterium]|nr:type II toxin-antitoxin system VapC family toxin [Anaerolineae bacterium]
MRYLLDTNICIRIINGRSHTARTKLLNVSTKDVVVCSIVRAELFYGAAKSQTQQATRRKQDLFLKPFATLPFDDLAADIYGGIRAQLEKKGTPIGPLDMQIAAIAMAHELILVTHNTREFNRVTGLNLEDWESKQ